MTEITVHLDGLKLTVKIDSLINDPPNPDCRDSDYDFYGTREVEWRLVYGIETDEDGKVIECGYLPWWLNKITEEHAEAIEAAIWQQYEEAKDDRHE